MSPTLGWWTFYHWASREPICSLVNKKSREQCRVIKVCLLKAMILRFRTPSLLIHLNIWNVYNTELLRCNVITKLFGSHSFKLITAPCCFYQHFVFHAVRVQGEQWSKALRCYRVPTRLAKAAPWWGESHWGISCIGIRDPLLHFKPVALTVVLSETEHYVTVWWEGPYKNCEPNTHESTEVCNQWSRCSLTAHARLSPYWQQISPHLLWYVF